MADITTQHSHPQKGLVKRIIKKTTRVDLTPMVDLGFLLITFFVFTSTLAQPRAMDMMVPNDTGDSNDPIAESAALTVVLAANNTIYYYEGRDAGAVVQQTTYAASGLRQLLYDKRKKVMAVMGSDRMVLIIKASDKSTFKNLVNTIDESAICMIRRYYIDVPGKDDLKMIN